MSEPIVKQSAVEPIVKQSATIGDWLSQYAVNFSDTMIWPLLVFTIVCLLVIAHGFDIRSKSSKRDTENREYMDAKWRIHTSAQIIVICWVIFAVVSSVPEPNYIIKEVEAKIDPTNVDLPANATRGEQYTYVLNKCLYNYQDSNIATNDRTRICNENALLALNPDLKVIRSTKVITKVFTNSGQASYDDMYDKCLDQWALDEARNDKHTVFIEKSKVCHTQAKDSKINQHQEFVKVSLKQYD